MKKLFLILSISLLGMLGLLIVSCGDDDETTACDDFKDAYAAKWNELGCQGEMPTNLCSEDLPDEAVTLCKEGLNNIPDCSMLELYTCGGEETSTN